MAAPTQTPVTPPSPPPPRRAAPVARPQAHAAHKNFGALQGLRSGDWNTWKPILGRALPGALVGGVGAWAADRMLTGKGEDEEDEKRNFWRRMFLGGVGALGGGYLGGSAAWKNQVAPGLKQGLGRSLIDPEGAFAAGMEKNWKANMMSSAEELKGQPWQPGGGHGFVEKLDSVLETAAAPFDYPILRDIATPHATMGWLRPLFGSRGDYQAERFRAGENPFAGALPGFLGASKFQSPGNTDLRSIYHATGLERLAPAILGAQSSQDPEALSQLQDLVAPHLARLQVLNKS